MSAYLGQIYAIVWKDLLLELRTRERVVAMGAFATQRYIKAGELPTQLASAKNLPTH